MRYCNYLATAVVICLANPVVIKAEQNEEANRSIECRCEYPDESFYDTIHGADSLFDVMVTEYVVVNGTTVLPSFFDECKNIEFICPGEETSNPPRQQKCGKVLPINEENNKVMGMSMGMGKRRQLRKTPKDGRRIASNIFGRGGKKRNGGKNGGMMNRGNTFGSRNSSAREGMNKKKNREASQDDEDDSDSSDDSGKRKRVKRNELTAVILPEDNPLCDSTLSPSPTFDGSTAAPTPVASGVPSSNIIIATPPGQAPLAGETILSKLILPVATLPPTVSPCPSSPTHKNMSDSTTSTNTTSDAPSSVPTSTQAPESSVPTIVERDGNREGARRRSP